MYMLGILSVLIVPIYSMNIVHDHDKGTGQQNIIFWKKTIVPLMQMVFQKSINPFCLSAFVVADDNREKILSESDIYQAYVQYCRN